MKTRLFFLVAGVLLYPVLTTVQAESLSYPSRAVVIVLPSPPGGNPDVLARLVGNRLSQRMGVQFVVENRTGGGGNIGAAIAAKATPDGYTLALLASHETSINPHIYLNLPYTVNKDFVPIAELATVPTVLAVSASLPVKSLAEFIEYAKARPNSLNYGSSGSGSMHHLTMAAFQKVAGIRMTHIPYKGSSQTVPALLAGDIQAAFVGIPNIRDFASAGRLKLLALSSSERVFAMPSVPTLKDLGFNNFNLVARIGLFVPAGTPNDVRVKLSGEVKKVLAESELQKRMDALGMTVSKLDPTQYSSVLDDDYINYGAMVRELGLKVE